ncbi:Flp pilus assembly protein CpaB [Aquisphaera insulae]|uniref:Flp pilus assembly protein CpaB n=1 Tax=Aquisphaera insulae TaxID=2712864 RepID=UPI0013EBE6B9|nr:Flp pilus assembly protein CpaB [Aquisphaera insulae]
MNGRSLMVLSLAVVLGLGAMIISMKYMGKPPAVEEETQDVIVAARDFKHEEILKADMVNVVRMARKSVPPGAFAAFKDVEDRWVSTTMIEGDLIVEKKLGPKGTPPGLVANIPKGMRAFAVEVNEQSGVSGFVLPGHRVDVIRYEAPEAGKQPHADMILQNVLVLASGQVFTRSEEKSLQNHTVTLAVTPEQASILVAAKANGPLSLSLRGVNDHDVVARPKEAPEMKGLRDDLEKERQARLKLEKDNEEIRQNMAKKQAGPTPEEMAALKGGLDKVNQKLTQREQELESVKDGWRRYLTDNPPDERQARYVSIYRPIREKEGKGDRFERVPLNGAAHRVLAKSKDQDVVKEKPLPGVLAAEPQGFGSGVPAITGLGSATTGGESP